MRSGGMNWGKLSEFRDEIYGISILWIFIYHLGSIFRSFKHNWTIWDLIFDGNIGVDVFLLMSGVCLFFSMKQREAQGESFKALRNAFYRKRFPRLILLYCMVCLPVLLLRYAGLENGLWQFARYELVPWSQENSYWFIFCIAACYLIYPYLYRWMKQGKTKGIMCGLLLYGVSVLLLAKFWIYFRTDCCRTFARFPVFVMGALLGEAVWEKKQVKGSLLLGSIASIFAMDPAFFWLKKAAFLKGAVAAIKYMYRSIFGLGSALLMIMLLEAANWPGLNRMLRRIGSCSLEVYIAHVSLMTLAIRYWSNYPPENGGLVFLFITAFCLLTLLISWAMRKIEKRILK